MTLKIQKDANEVLIANLEKRFSKKVTKEREDKETAISKTERMISSLRNSKKTLKERSKELEMELVDKDREIEGILRLKVANEELKRKYGKYVKKYAAQMDAFQVERKRAAEQKEELEQKNGRLRNQVTQLKSS